MTVQARTNLQDIAQRANVPTDLVAKVILGKHGVPDATRRRVLAVLAEAGLIQISEERAPSQPSVGIVIPGPVMDDYIGEVVRAIAETAAPHGYAATINIQSPTTGDEFETLFGDDCCEGLIAIVPFNYQHLIALCHQYNRPYVLVDYQGDDEVTDVPSVEVKNREGIVQVMCHLFELGHTRIAFITGRLEHASARQRLQGYVSAFAEAGLPYNPDLVVIGDWRHKTAHQLTLPLLQLETPPTAIVASNDLSAFGAIQAVTEAGLEVGKDVSITGFDDIRMATSITPPLTTVRQPMYDMGEIAADMLMKRLRGEPVSPMRVQLDTEFIIRESTGVASIPSEARSVS